MMRYSYKRLKKLEMHEIFWESNQYYNAEYKVSSLPIENYSDGLESKQLRWSGIDINTGEEVQFLITEKLTHYGPSIYSLPTYVHPKKIKG